MLKNCWGFTVACLVLGVCALGLGESRGSDAGADAYLVERIPEEWLPQSSVIAITQTHDGYLWLGTLNGLVRFDGLHCTIFTEANTPGLKSSQIVFLSEDSRSNLWVGTETAGVVLIDRNGTVKTVDFGPREREARLVSATEDAGGTVWLNTADGLFARYTGGRLELLGHARPMISEKTNRLWLGVAGGLVSVTAVSNSSAFFWNQEFSLQKLDFLLPSKTDGIWLMADGRVQKWTGGQLERDWGPYPWGTAQINTACEDGEGNLVVGTQNAGVYWYTSPGNAIHISGTNGLSHDTVLSLCVDREGDLWVGTDGGGLNRVKRKIFGVVPGSQGLTIQSAYDDPQRGLWFVNYGWRLFCWKDGALKSYGPDQGLFEPKVVFADRAGTLWVGSASWGLFTLQADGRFQQAAGEPGRQNPAIAALYQDRDGSVWVGSQGGLLQSTAGSWRRYTVAEGLSANDVRAIIGDTNGDLWIGTDGGGLNRMQNGRFTAFRKADGLPSDSVSALCMSPDGALWVGTPGSGLARFKAGKWTRYTTEDGLISDSVGYLIHDDQGNLWIGSNSGLMRASDKSLGDFADGVTNSVTVRGYGKSDGMPTRECAQGSQPAACRSADGKLWFPTTKGLLTLDPAQLQPNRYPPPVRIESVLVDRREQITNQLRSDSLSVVVVPAGKELVEIRYTSLNLASPQRARFRYRLGGHESGWTDDTSNAREARYSNLPPGDYQFQVTACNEDGVWNTAGVTLNIRVLPPFWRTLWFQGGSALFLLALIVTVVRYISTQKLQRQLALLKQQEALEKERSRIARDLHDQLGANLMQVSLLGEMAQADKNLPAEVETHAQQITQTAQETTRALDEIVWAVNPSNDTLEGLITYACKYAQDYLSLAGLRYRLDAPTDFPEASIAPEVRHNTFLAFKEAVNNVVKHAQASEVRLRFRLAGQCFQIEIEDDGRGVAGQAEKTGRNGLRNMRKRMEDIGGTFSIGPAAPRGTVVCLSVPIRKDNGNHGFHSRRQR